MAVQETVLCSATKDPKHVLQDESLYEPCFLTRYVFRWSLSKCHVTKRPCITSELGNTKMIQNDVNHPDVKHQ